jgi:hypothetical protein
MDLGCGGFGDAGDKLSLCAVLDVERMNKNTAVLVFGSAMLLALSTFGLGLFLAGPGTQASTLRRYEQKWVTTTKSKDQPSKEMICGKESDVSSSGLCSQWRSTIAAEDSAFWAKWAFFVGILGTAGLLATIMQGREALREHRMPI